jgi:hypothetical protein
MAKHTVKINRAPVLTLWAKVVGERLGYKADEALSLAKAVAGLNAQSKGRRIGIYQKPEEGEERPAPKKPEGPQPEMITVLGRPVPTIKTHDGLRAVIAGDEIEPGPVRRYLEQKFGEALSDAEEAMESLAKSYSKDELEDEAYPLYEKFRPKIPAGKKGWGAAGELDLGYIRSLARKHG